MFCRAGFDQWRTTIMQHLSHMSKPQATVLALWSFGMVLARSRALTAVSHWLAKGMQCTEHTVRQQLREQCWKTGAGEPGGMDVRTSVATLVLDVSVPRVLEWMQLT